MKNIMNCNVLGRHSSRIGSSRMRVYMTINRSTDNKDDHLYNYIKKCNKIQILDPIQHILNKLPYDDQCDLIDFFNELEITNKIEEVK